MYDQGRQGWCMFDRLLRAGSGIFSKDFVEEVADWQNIRHNEIPYRPKNACKHCGRKYEDRSD